MRYHKLKEQFRIQAWEAKFVLGVMKSSKTNWKSKKSLEIKISSVLLKRIS